MLLRLLLVVSGVATLTAAPVELVPPSLRSAVQPQIALTSTGRIHVTFGQGNAIYHTSSADGREFSAPVKIGELDKLALGKRRGPRITASDEVLLVTAISHADGKLHAWTSTDSGKTWSEGSSVNTVDGSAREGLQTLAGDGRGRVLAAWLDLRAGGMEVWSRESRDGGKSWQPEMRVYAAPGGNICPCCVPNLAISPQGEVAVMWRNELEGSRDLYLATRSGDQPFSDAVKLGSGTWQLKACPMDGGSLAFSPAGKWLAAWRRDKTVFTSSAAGQERLLGSDASQPVAAYAGDTPILLWEAGDALMAKRGDASAERFAAGAKSASAVSGKDAVYVVWEGSTAGERALLFERVR
ncbi:sialidase family protein [Haloferula sp. BvORR071]|uniref:sialidase family protein n=1 Tax=Haloferula sp. BvORR071 TaxID=1396141 RepID=UPI0006973838|nr:sialidase family protein [Haloferula sp. BvORR071]